MKRIHIFLLLSFALSATVALGYDSHDEKANTYQVIQTDMDLTLFNAPKVAVFAAELPVALIIEAPHLGQRAPLNAKVSEKLASGFKMPARAPPDR